MPGHTPGTLSYLFEVRDNGKPLRVAYVGGTAFPFDASAAYYEGYIASSKKMAKAAADYGATVLLSNHSAFDDAYLEAHAAATRQPGEANPFEGRMEKPVISVSSKVAQRLRSFARTGSKQEARSLPYSALVARAVWPDI
jgi:glyoxylase-like metal-dependent hydrolase (beta-lactamase superfamily II)